MSREEIIARNSIRGYLERIGAMPKTRFGLTTCRCPLGGHPDKHPSFTVKCDRWTCWSHPGGRVSGTIIDLIMAVEGLTLAEVLRRLSR